MPCAAVFVDYLWSQREMKERVEEEYAVDCFFRDSAIDLASVHPNPHWWNDGRVE